MTGQLFVVPPGRPEDPYVRLVLELEDGREIRFRDIRKFGRIGLYGARDDGRSVRGRPGRSRSSDAFTVAAFRRRLRGRKGRLKPLLLDQTFIAGVGNIYADEALWAAKLHPLRTAGTLRPNLRTSRNRISRPSSSSNTTRTYGSGGPPWGTTNSCR